MKNKNTIITISIVALIILIGYFFYSKKAPSDSDKGTEQLEQSNAIKNNNDLTKASDELNNTNIDSIDNELNENTSESSSL